MTENKGALKYLINLIDMLARHWNRIPFAKMFSSVITVFFIAILLTILGTFLGDEETQLALQKSFPALCLERRSLECLVIEPGAGWFLSIFLLFSILFLGRELAIGRAVKAEKIEMLQAVSNSPSQNLLDKFVDLYDGLEYAIKSKSQHENIAIAFALGGLIAMVKSYQPSWVLRKKTYYSAEIFIYKPISEIEEQHMPSILNELSRFLYNQNNIGEVQGVLESTEGLAVEDIEGGIQKKEGYQRILLPIPVQKTAPGNKKISRVLAGSAAAYVGSEDGNYFHYIDNTESLGNLYGDANRYDFHPSLIRNEILFFSGEGSKMKSIFSMRFGDQDSAANSGVITIYCDRQNLFINQSMVESFKALSRPIVHKIEELLIMRQSR